MDFYLNVKEEILLEEKNINNSNLNYDVKNKKLNKLKQLYDVLNQYNNISNYIPITRFDNNNFYSSSQSFSSITKTNGDTIIEKKIYETNNGKVLNDEHTKTIIDKDGKKFNFLNYIR